MKSKEKIEHAIELHEEGRGDASECARRERLRTLYWVLDKEEKAESIDPVEHSNPLVDSSEKDEKRNSEVSRDEQG